MKITRATIERLIKEELRVILPEIKTSVQSNVISIFITWL